MSRWKDDVKRREWQTTRRNIYLKKLLELKIKQGKCSLCGWNEHPEILEFDHLIKETKKFNFSSGSLGNYSWDGTVVPEINKCILICPNCHKWKHYNEKEWFREHNNAKRKG